MPARRRVRHHRPPPGRSGTAPAFDSHPGARHNPPRRTGATASRLIGNLPSSPRRQGETVAFVNPKLIPASRGAATPSGHGGRAGVVALLALGLPAAAAAAPPRAADPPHGPPGPPVTVLHLQQIAEKSLAPDRLRVEMRAEQSGTDPRQVQAAINQRMAAALKKARQAAGITVATGDYALFQQALPNAPPRWRGSQSLILKGEDAKAILTLTGALQSDGLVMSSLAYTVSPEVLDGAEEDLTAAALAALDRRAAAIADALHLTVLRYRDLTVGNAESGPPPILHGAAMSAAMAAPVAAPGRARIRLTVRADLLLVPGRPPPP